MTKSARKEWLACIQCDAQYDVTDVRYTCTCGNLLEVQRPKDWHRNIGPKLFDSRLTSRLAVDVSGVWRFREGILAVSEDQIVTHPEGRTRIYQRPVLGQWAGLENLRFKHEGENPTGSFKDRGMTVAVTQAKRLGKQVVACASTGNTSAALAAYAAHAGLKAAVFLPSGKVAIGKIAQAIGYGAICLGIKGDFDEAMALVQEASAKLDVYMVNSLNPFRLEGQKSIMWEMLQDLNWQAPDWVVVPAGNLGNTSAFGKALQEAYEAGWIKTLPRLAAVQAQGANPFYLSSQEGFKRRHTVQAETVATAIRIGNPVNYEKAVRVMRNLRGHVEQVSDIELMAAKVILDRAGIGCEPASACTLAGVRKMRESGILAKNESVVCILTGHMLKDPDAVLGNAAARVIDVSADLKSVAPYLTGQTKPD